MLRITPGEIIHDIEKCKAVQRSRISFLEKHKPTVRLDLQPAVQRMIDTYSERLLKLENL